MLGYAIGSKFSKSSTRTGPEVGLPHGAGPLPFPPTSLLTRISESNVPSIRLFEKLGFSITKRVEVFGEVEMRWGRAQNVES
ncbi:hypothetical protein C8J57DRAFT_598882 [Mycena rebaudengoi]|nr:hypothetical protein C8J57DRAFT_598882 [Mycena rebaudengoi]